MKRKKLPTTAINITRVPIPLKETLAAVAMERGRSLAAQCIVGLWDYLDHIGVPVKGGGGNRTRSHNPTRKAAA